MNDFSPLLKKSLSPQPLRYPSNTIANEESTVKLSSYKNAGNTVSKYVVKQTDKNIQAYKQF